MIATEPASIDMARLLLDLLIVIAAAKVAAEVAERIRLPAVLAEICAGILLGPSVLGAVSLGGNRGVSIAVLAEIGVVLLLFQVGMEMDLTELARVGRASTFVAVIGVAVPFAAGVVVATAFGEGGETAAFIGAALTATSVGITARVFGDLRALATVEARIVLGAAVADDVLGLVILTVVVKVVTGDDVGVDTVAATFGLAIGFLAITALVGLLAVPRLLDAVHRLASSDAAVSVAALVLILSFAELADAAQLAFIIGAFMAGLAVGRSQHRDRVAGDLGAAANLFIPVFFVQIGLNADIAAMFSGDAVWLAAALTVVAVAGKLLSALGALGTRADRLLIGIGMVPRGEVGLIFASIGLSSGVLDDGLYGSLLLVILVTTLVTPPLLRMRIGTNASAAANRAPPPTDEPAGGWIRVTGSEIELDGVPPAIETVPIALRVAALTDESRPSGPLLDWFATHRLEPLLWQHTDTSALVRVIRAGQPRAWRLLDVTGVLERALPEVAAAMHRRRADLGDLDPIGALRFAVVDRLDALAPVVGLPSDELMIAGLVADVCSDAAGASCAADLAARLVHPTEAQRICSIVADGMLLRAGANDPSVFENVQLLQLATHLAGAAHARDAHTMALALGPLPRWQREVLDERLALLIEALDHPEVTGSEVVNVAGSRRVAAEHLLEDSAAIERLRHASVTYLLSHEPAELARQAMLVEPLPHAGAVRVAVSVAPHAEPRLAPCWQIDVACRDTRSLLAHLTATLTQAGLDIIAATIATWPDGAVLDTFIVRSREEPSASALAQQFEVQLRKPLRPTPLPELQLAFDNHSLPWHTAVTVSGVDQPGALGAVTAAFAAAKVVVHTARIATDANGINDRFAVGDPLGRKLDEAAMQRVRRSLAGERTTRRSALTRSR